MQLVATSRAINPVDDADNVIMRGDDDDAYDIDMIL